MKKRTFRQEDGLFLVEGAQPVTEALGDATRVKVLFATDPTDDVVVRAEQSGVDIVTVTGSVMEKLTSTVTPQGLVAVAQMLDVSLDDVPAEGCVALLHEVRDPGNAGTVLRSADAAGASAVLFSQTSVDVYNPKTVRASAGSLFHLPVVAGVATEVAIESLREKGVRILAMDTRGATDLYDADLSGPVGFVFGNEAHGLPDEIRDQTDQVVKVPIPGRAESLNLAAAATVCLFEWARRRSTQR